VTLASPVRRLRPLVATLVLALVVTACDVLQVTQPPATPTDFPGLSGRLAVAGILVGNYVSGDPGCDDPALVPTAIRFTASGLDQPEPVTLYLYIFRHRDAFERNRNRIGPCAQSYVTDPQSFEQVEQSPYVVAGQGPWAPAFEAAFRRVLTEAAGTGG
jgi:hypothetical protein